MNDTTVIILAAGKGTRMQTDVPKVLVELDNKPMLIGILENCQTIATRIIIIVNNATRDKIEQCVFNYDFVNIEYVTQSYPMGTGHAIQQCLPILNKNDNKILILNGDMPLIQRNLLEQLVVRPIPCIATTTLLDPQGYGRIIEVDNKIMAIIEQKDCNKFENDIKQVNAGIYLFKYELIAKYINEIQFNKIKHEFYITDMIRILVNNDIKINNFIVPGHMQTQIMGVNTQTDLNILQNIIKCKKI